MKKNRGYISLDRQCKAIGLPEPVKEFRFHPHRLWRFDYAWPELRLALEVEGGVFARKGATKCDKCGLVPAGRHATGAGFLGDIEKYNAATRYGWRLVRVTPQMMRTGEALALVETVIGALRSPLEPVPVQSTLELAG